MKSYIINKGVGKRVEFKGLQAQYLLFFLAEIVVFVFLFLIMSILGIPTLVTASILILIGSITMPLIFKLNRKYGVSGMMLVLANKKTPKQIRNNYLFSKNGK